MTTDDFLQLLRQHPGHGIELRLPDGSSAPAHFHITEVGHISKRFIDCGGKAHSHEACLLQVWVADDIDHRITTDKLLQIFDRADQILPNLELPVELEHEAPVLTQLPLESHKADNGTLQLILGLKKTDCLAKDICMPDFRVPALPGSGSNAGAGACTPGGGCC